MPVSAASSATQGAELALDLGAVGPRQPAPGPFEPGTPGGTGCRSRREWIWPMKTLAAPQTGCGVGGELALEPAEPRDQLGAGGDHARLVARAASPRGPAAPGGG